MNCPKPKYFNCQICIEYKISINSHKYNIYKDLKNIVYQNVLKINNGILLFIAKKFVNIFIKNLVQYILKKKGKISRL